MNALAVVAIAISIVDLAVNLLVYIGRKRERRIVREYEELMQKLGPLRYTL